MPSTLSAVEVHGLANTCGTNAANLIAAAVEAAGTPGYVDSESGALQLGTNTTDIISSKGLFTEPASNAITARAGGGQTLATALTAQYNRIGTCATAGDSYRLPTSRAGLEVTVVNDGAAAAQAFGAGTDTIDSVATATGVAHPVGAILKFVCTAAGNWRSTLVIPETLDNTVVTGTGAMVAGAIEGAKFVSLTASGQAAITLTTRTAAQIQAGVPDWQIGKTYRLRIVNNNTGTLTTAGGANVTMTSTILAGHYADYTVLFATATTITITQITVAPTTAAAHVAGIATGYKLARGVTAVTGTGTVITGLTTVVAVVASASSDIDGAALANVSATIGDQAGTPAAGSVILKCWKVTTGGAAGNPTEIAASAAANVSWIAIGT